MLIGINTAPNRVFLLTVLDVMDADVIRMDIQPHITERQLDYLVMQIANKHFAIEKG